MSSVSPPAPSAAPPMWCPRPRTVTARSCARAWSSAATTSSAPVGWTTSAGVDPAAPFHRSVLASNPAAPGTRTAPAVLRRSAPRSPGPSITARSVRANASGRSTGGSSAAPSITCNGQFRRALTAAATASGVARSWRPHTSAVGAAIRASSAGGIARNANCSIIGPSAARACAVRARARFAATNAAHGVPIAAWSRGRSCAQRCHSASWVDSSGSSANACSAIRNAGAGANGASPRASTSTSRPSRPGSVAAKRAAIAPPSACPASAGGAGHVASTSSASQRRTNGASSSAPAGRGAPWPGRSGAITRWRRVSAGRTRHQWTAPPPGPCSSTSGVPLPPSSTGVSIPASVIWRRRTGTPASRRRSASASRIGSSWMVIGASSGIGSGQRPPAARRTHRRDHPFARRTRVGSPVRPARARTRAPSPPRAWRRRASRRCC